MNNDQPTGMSRHYNPGSTGVKTFGNPPRNQTLMPFPEQNPRAKTFLIAEDCDRLAGSVRKQN
jgi:hypothetical protein